MPTKTGNQTTITFATTSWSGRVRRIGGLEENLPVLDDDDLSTTNHMRYCPGDLIEISPITIEFYWDPDTPPPIGSSQQPETVTIAYPLLSGQSTAAALAGSAFINNVTGGDLANNERSIGTLQLQFDGVSPPAYTAAT